MIVSNDPSPLTFISDYYVRLPEIYGKKIVIRKTLLILINIGIMLINIARPKKHG